MREEKFIKEHTCWKAIGIDKEGRFVSIIMADNPVMRKYYEIGKWTRAKSPLCVFATPKAAIEFVQRCSLHITTPSIAILEGVRGKIVNHNLYAFSTLLIALSECKKKTIKELLEIVRRDAQSSTTPDGTIFTPSFKPIKVAWRHDYAS